ncbi:MAG: helix-hairpin-helix domain-containing protein, partial [Bacteroidales bacterium]|nr:helix-hairpin-helix domain-containing protein [Bacteroidales bacterium]
MKTPVHSRAKSLVAFILVIVGFQLLLFGYRAAERILLAHRDRPDTVYVVDSALAARLLEEDREGESGARSRVAAGLDAGVAGGSGAVDSSPGVSIRKNAPHEADAERIVSRSPRRKVENFRFNPNTATLDEFRRLGFTDKQAQSIERYRQKGGRFRRKSDFAKSYVVSDTLYARLEPYIDIPLLDLNRADSAAFDALPGIGGYFARQMVLHRERLGGSYSDARQLLEIYHFDQPKLDAIADLITIDTALVRPYPLWTHPIDSLRKHPAIGNYSTARSIVFFREHNPREKWTIPALESAGILT